MTRRNDFFKKQNIQNHKELDAILKAAFYRQDCPSTLTLGEYQLEFLPTSEEAILKEHLDRCPHCQKELGRLSAFLIDDELGLASTPAGKKSGWSDWRKERGFEWRRARQSGPAMIRLLVETLASAFPQPLMAVKGRARPVNVEDEPGQESAILRRIVLDADQLEDLDLEITVNQSGDDQCAVLVHAEALKRWPHLAGTEVLLTAGNRQMKEETNEEGDAVFQNVPRDLIDSLTIEVRPPGE